MTTNETTTGTTTPPPTQRPIPISYGFDDDHRQLMVVNRYEPIDDLGLEWNLDAFDDYDFFEMDPPAHPQDNTTHYESMVADGSGDEVMLQPTAYNSRLRNFPDFPTDFSYIWSANTAFSKIRNLRLLDPTVPTPYWISRIKTEGERTGINQWTLTLPTQTVSRLTLSFYGRISTILSNYYYPNYCFTHLDPYSESQQLIALALIGRSYMDQTTDLLADDYEFLDYQIVQNYAENQDCFSVIFEDQLKTVKLVYTDFTPERLPPYEIPGTSASPGQNNDHSDLDYQIPRRRRIQQVQNRTPLRQRQALRPVFSALQLLLLSFLSLLSLVIVYLIFRYDLILRTIFLNTAFSIFLSVLLVYRVRTFDLEKTRRLRSRLARPQDTTDPTTTEDAGASLETVPSKGVELVENRGTITSAPMPTDPVLPNLIGFESEPAIFPDLTDRWNNVGELSWATSDVEGTILASFNIPLDLVLALATNPTTLPLLQYVYFIPQLTYRLQLNSTKFHSGLLVFGVQYYPELDNGTDGVRTPTSDAQVFQLDYSTISAGSSTIAELKIPFQSPFDMIPIRSGAMGSSQYYATVYIAIAAALGIGEGGSDSVSLSQQVKFSCDGEQTTFYGLRSRLAISQGLSDIISGVANIAGEVGSSLGFIPGVGEVASAIHVAGGLASSVIKPVESLFGGLGSMFKSKNMDRPSIPTDPTHFIRFPAPSLSWGEGPLPSKSLRLQPHTLTPHVPGTVPSNGDIVHVDCLKRKWGLVMKFEISTSMAANTLLCTLPNSPINGYSVGDDYLPTPCAGVAGLYSFYHGGIEYRFKVAKADPHSFRLRFSDIPSNATTAGELQNYKSVVQDFEEINEYDHALPYMAPTKVLPTFLNGSATTSGYLQVRLESQMISMGSCADTITVNVFHRGAPNLTLAVPRANPWTPSVTSTPNSGDPVFLFNTNSWLAVKDANFAWNAGDILATSNYFVSTERYTLSSSYVIIISQSNMRVLLNDNFRSETGVWIDTTTINTSDFPSAIDDQTFQTTDNTGVSSARSFFFYSFAELTGLNWNIEALAALATPQDEVDERESTNNEHSHASVTHSMTELVFGEAFPLHSSIRRPQPFIAQTVTFPETGYYTFTLDLNYGEPFARATGQQVSNLTFLHDAYRFGKGGLIYYFCIDQSTAPTKIYATHSPAGFSTQTNPSPTWNKLVLSGAAIQTDPLSNFGHDIIATNDSTIPVIVPYYTLSKYLVNGYDSAASGLASNSVYGFGQLQFRGCFQAGQEVTFHIERAAADDLDLFVFQGWPLCTNSIDYVNVNAEESLSALTTLKQNLATPQDFCEPSNVISDDSNVIALEDTKESQLALENLESHLDLVLEMTSTRSLSRRFTRYVKKMTPAIPQDLPPRSVMEANSFILLLKTHHAAEVVLPIDVQIPQPILDIDGVRPLITRMQNEFAKKDYNRLLLLVLSLYPDVDPDLLTWANIPQRTLTTTLARYVGFVTDSIPATIKDAFDRFDDEHRNIPSSLIGMIKSVLSHFGKSITNLNVAYRLYSNYKMIASATDYWVKAMAMTNLLADFGIIQTRGLIAMGIVSELFYYLRQKPTIIQVYGGVSAWTPQDLFSEETKTPEVVAKWASLLMGGVAALAGFSSAKNWASGVETFARNLSNVSNSWHKMLTTSCTFIIDYILYLLGVEEPATLAMSEMADAKIDGEKWLKRVLWMVNPERHDQIISDPALRREVSELYDEGSVFVRVLAASKKTPANSSVFLSIWKQLVTLYQETGEVPDSVRANMTPICIWLHGAPGVGKSEAAKTIAVRLAQLMNIAHEGDPFFIRRPRKFWDGYNGQPIIIFDDAGQVTSQTFLDQFYEDWFGIMTSAPFSPEFSAISEKKKYVTPQIVIACSNLLYPTLSGISSPRAFQRRRDLLIEVSLSADLTKLGIEDCNDLRIDPQLFETFGHLRFGQYPSTTNRGLDGKITDIKPQGNYTLDELLKIIYPRCDHLRKIRLQSAQSNAGLRDALSPTKIEANRKSLLDKIGMSDMASGVSNIVGEVTEALPQDQSEHVPSAYYSFSIQEKGMCFTSCADLDKRCFCTVPAFISNGGRVDYCFNHGTFIGRKIVDGHRKLIIFGDCDTCQRSLRARGFDQALSIVLNDDAWCASANRGSFPPRRSGEPRLTELEVDLSGFFTELDDTASKSWWGIPRKWWLPLGLGVAAYLLFQGLSLFNSAKDLFSSEKNADNVNATMNEVASAVVGQMASSGSVKTQRHQRARSTISPAASQGTVDDLIPRLRRNRVHFKVYYKCGNTARVYGLGIFDRFMISPFHSWNRFDSEIVKVELTLSSGAGSAGTIDLTLDDLALNQINGTDLVIINLLNRRIPRFKDISRSLVPKGELDRISARACVINVLEKDSYPRVDHVHIRTSEQMATYDLDNRLFHFKMVGFSYPLEADGMCGSVLVDSKSGYIIGMHTTAMGGMGYSTLLTSEYFGNLRPELDLDEPDLAPGGMVDLSGEFIPIGCLPQDQSVTLPLRTDIIKSDCFEVLGPSARYPVNMTTPGEVRPGIEKLTLAVEKQCAPTIPWALEDIDHVHEHLKRKILAMPPASSAVKVRSVEEAIVGVQGLPFAEALQRNTSVGWPLSTLGKGSKKKNFIDYSETPTGLRVKAIHREAVQIYTTNWEKRRKGIVPFSPYQNFLKDERLKPGKMPRLINGCPLDQVIDCRRYCMDFFSSLTDNGAKIGIMIGLNVHGPGWSEFVNRLLSMGDSFLCGDYSAFGPSLDPELVLRCGELCSVWLEKNTEFDDEWRTIVSTIFENLAFNTQVSADTVTQMLCGQPSGNPYTAQINSLVNLYYLGLAWVDIFRGTTLEDISCMDKFVEVGVYGDDVIMTVHPSVLKYYNNRTLRECFARRGIKYGDAAKDGSDLEFRPLEEATFLKCFIVPHPTRGRGFWLAALEKAMIQDVPSWIRRGGDSRYNSLENCVEACRLAYAWGPVYFQEVCNKVITFWQQRGESLAIPSWKYLDALFFGELRGVDIPEYIDPSNYAWC